MTACHVNHGTVRFGIRSMKYFLTEAIYSIVLRGAVGHAATILQIVILRTGTDCLYHALTARSKQA